MIQLKIILLMPILNASHDEIKEAAKLSFANEFIEKLPNKYDTLIGENGIRLSGGEKQRLSIARAILKKSPIILLDEATSSLDAETENKIQEAINFLTKGRTTIVIAHRLSTILNADKIYVIDKGLVVGEGKHKDLVITSNIYKNFYEKQIKKQVMLFIYRILINIILIISPIILIYRLLIGKEDLKRFKEKFCFFSKEKKGKNLIWFHGASVGELYSIMPLLEKLEKNKKISQILVTSNTLSSSKIIQNYRFKKLIHQFFPIDTNFHSKKFLDYWKPSSAYFIDSEIWPNMIDNLNKKNIPVILLNGRITKKTFNRWKMISSFSKKIFNNFNLCLSSSKESKKVS